MGKIIKSYEDFTNEELNIKKALAGAALGAGLAFGSPQQSMASEPIPTEITQQSYDYSQVFHVDSTLTKSDIKTIIMNKLGTIPGVQITSNLQDKITCLIKFNSKPKNSNGMAYGTMDISFKDGRYKVDIYNIYFDYTGQQPQSIVNQVGSGLGRQAVGVATNVITSQIRNPILQNVARQTANTVTRQTMASNQSDKPNLTYQQAVSEDPTFSQSIDNEISNITSSITSAFSGKQQQEDW